MLVTRSKCASRTILENCAITRTLLSKTSGRAKVKHMRFNHRQVPNGSLSKPRMRGTGVGTKRFRTSIKIPRQCRGRTCASSAEGANRNGPAISPGSDKRLYNPPVWAFQLKPLNSLTRLLIMVLISCSAIGETNISPRLQSSARGN